MTAFSKDSRCTSDKELSSMCPGHTGHGQNEYRGRSNDYEDPHALALHGCNDHDWNEQE